MSQNSDLLPAAEALPVPLAVHTLVPLQSPVVLQKPLQYSDCWGFAGRVEKHSLEPWFIGHGERR